jgi:hypothetical protein
MKHLFTTILAALITLSAAGQESRLHKLDLEARVDYM